MMTEPPDDWNVHIPATVVAMWSAMIGGAAGGLIGGLGGGTVLPILIGSSVGLLASVVALAILTGLSFGVSVLLHTEFEDQPIGCPTSSQLSAGLGSLGGVIGALVLARMDYDSPASEPAGFMVCWSVTACLPVVITVVMVGITMRRAERQRALRRAPGYVVDDTVPNGGGSPDTARSDAP